MSRAIKGIKVEACLTTKSECPRFRINEKYCPATLEPWDGQGIAPNCPLPPWPSITDFEVCEMMGKIYRRGIVAGKEDLINFLKSIGVEIKGGNDEEK